MVRVGSRKSKRSCQSMHSKRDTSSHGNCPHYSRNPFLIFLQQFRNNEKHQKYRMSAYESSAVAGQLWRCMSDAERRPYICLAQQLDYIYKSRNRKVNWVLCKLREVLADGTLQLQGMWNLASKLNTWTDCVMDNVFCLVEQESSDDCED